MYLMDFKKHPGDTAMFSPSGKVLVVDDDDGIRHLCREVLESAGYRVETAKNGLEGLTKVRRNEYDLVVSDVNMPELDGMEFFDGAASSCPGLAERFLFMSGSISEELEEAVTARGALFLPKPFRITAPIGAGLANERKARVVWSRKDGDKALSGLRFEAPMPASSIINMHASNHACEDKAC